MDVERLLSLLPHERHHAHLRPRRRGPYRNRKRQKLSPEELLEFLATNKINTTGDLRKRRIQDRTCPLVHDFIGAFGRWKVAVEQAHGKQILRQPPPNDPDYGAKCVVQFDLWTQAKYLAARRIHPDVIPSSRQIRRVWGGFDNLLFAARKKAVRKTFEEYLRLERRLGRIPTAIECRQEGLDLTPLRSLLGSKWDVDDLLALRRRADDEIQKAS